MAEADLLGRLHSAHVVKVCDAGLSPLGEPYIVLELLEGWDLAWTLELACSLPESVVCRLGTKLATAIVEVHAVGVAPRNIKAANVFLSRGPLGEQQLKLLDFGVAKEVHSDSALEAPQVLGTPQYMAPEQFADPVSVDERTGIWAFGAVMYEMLAGEILCSSERQKVADAGVRGSLLPADSLRSCSPRFA